MLYQIPEDWFSRKKGIDILNEQICGRIISGQQMKKKNLRTCEYVTSTQVTFSVAVHIQATEKLRFCAMHHECGKLINLPKTVM